MYLPSASIDGGSENGGVKFVKLPNARTGNLQSFVLCGDQLYEIEMYNGDNPHDSKNDLRVTTKKDSRAVRSMILENRDDGKEGLILEEEEIYVSKRYNFVYSLISFFEVRFNGERYQTLDNLIDLINEDISAVSELPESLVAKSLELISDCIQEGDQQFFKYSKDKTLSFLKNKVELVAESFPKGIYERLIKPALNPADINKSIPSDVERLAKQKYSIYLISSYLKPELQGKLFQVYDFSRLDTYLADLEKERQQKRLAEEQINDINSMNANNKRNMMTQANGTIKKKPTPAKKMVKKLSLGPLDGFFKKK